MTVDWLALLIYLGGGAPLAYAAVRIVRHSEQRLYWRPGDDSTPADRPVAGSDTVDGYLHQMTSALALPSADVAEVRAELADHIADSIESLEAEGLDREQAIRESLARLGSPTELGRQIRVAHQSTRRLLAGAGGGVFAAAGGFVIGYVAGMAVAIVAVILVGLAIGIVSLAGVPFPNLQADHGDMINSLMIAIVLMAGAGTATRYAVRASAGLSRRAPRTVSIFWATAGALGFGWWAIFGMRGPMSWPGVVAFLCVPAIAFASAFYRIERPMPHVGRNALIAGVGGLLVAAVAVVGLVGMTEVSGSSGSSGGTLTPLSADQPPDMHFDRVAPMAPAQWLPDGSMSGGGWGQVSTSSGTALSIELSSSVLANWHDVRFEAWRGLTDGYGIDPGYSSALAIQPASVQGTKLSAVFHFERMRGAGSWWVVATAVAPDGRRYRLSDSPGGGGSSFNGSVWDWLTAPQ
jgi:hypothetical protein